MKNNRFFLNSNYNVEIEIRKDIMRNIYEACKLSYPKETGGVLFGYYSEPNLAIVTDIWEEKNIANKNETKFIRGINGLKSFSDNLWNKRQVYYLGEWHYHPNSNCNASNTDLDTIVKISKSKIYRCPEPIMLIVSSKKNWKFTEVIYLVNKENIIVLV